MKTHSKNSKITLLVSIAIFFYSITLGPYYTTGDQITYRLVYSELSNYNYTDFFLAREFYRQHIVSLEWGHFILIYFFSKFLEKEIFIALSNSLLVYLIISLFNKIKSSLLIAIIIVFTNYYMLVLFFSAERLKFSFIFLLFSILNIERIKRFSVFSFLAILTHVQIAIFYIIIYISSIRSNIIFFLSPKRYSISILLLSILLSLSFFMLSSHIFNKFVEYMSSFGGWNDLIKMLLLFILSLIYCDDYKEVFFIFPPLLLLCFLIGSQRINIMGYCIFLNYGLRYRKGFNIGVIVTTLYFSAAGYGFFYSILQNGNGFDYRLW